MTSFVRLGLLAVAVLAILLPAAGIAGGSAGNRATYQSESGWAFEYDPGWSLLPSQYSAMVLQSPPPAHGLVTVTPLTIPPATKDKGLAAFVDQLLEYRLAYFAARGQEYTILIREQGVLLDGTPFESIDDQIGGIDGGLSEILIAFKGDAGLSAVAETYAREWPQLASEFRAVLRSLRFTR